MGEDELSCCAPSRQPQKSEEREQQCQNSWLFKSSAHRQWLNATLHFLTSVTAVTAWEARVWTDQRFQDSAARKLFLHSAHGDISDVGGNVPWIRGDSISVGAMTTLLSKHYVLGIICLSSRPQQSAHSGPRVALCRQGHKHQLLPRTLQEETLDRRNEPGQHALSKTRT